MIPNTSIAFGSVTMQNDPLCYCQKTADILEKRADILEKNLTWYWKKLIQMKI